MLASEMAEALLSYVAEHGDGDVFMQYDTPNWFAVEEKRGESIKPKGVYFQLGENVHGGDL